MTKPTVYLIDAFAQIFRSYFAFAGKPLLNPDGKNVNAFFGFFKALFQLIKDKKPSHLAVVYDSRTPTFRSEIYPEYKAHRDAAPEDLLAQLPEIEEMLRVLGVPILQKDGFEADDLIATAATWCRAEEVPCWIVSGDKDLMQLVGGSVRMLRTDSRGQLIDYDAERVFADKGVRPDQIIDFLALLGDTSDNVPGVAGVGEKTAQKLLAEFGSLENLYNNLDKAGSESQRRKLAEGRESAWLSQRLVQLALDVDLGFPLPDLFDRIQLQLKDARTAAQLFLKQNAKGLAADALALAGSSAGERISAGESSEPAPQTAGKEVTGQYDILLTSDQITAYFKALVQAGTFAFDLETDSLDTLSCRILGVSFSPAAGQAAYLPLAAPDAACPDQTFVLKELKVLLENPSLKLIAHNGKFDLKVLASHGIQVPSLYFDTMIAGWLLDANANSFSLETLALNVLGLEGLSFDSLVKKGQTFADVPLQTAARYSSEDSDLTFRLYEKFAADLQAQNLSSLMFDLEMPLTALLAKIEARGIRLLAPELQAYAVELEAGIASIQAEIWDLCGEQFNLGSPKQLQEILFVKRQLVPPPRAKIKTGYSTDSDILEELALQDPVPAKILRYRALTKLKSTYVDTLPLLIHPKTGRIHTQLVQTGTATGRLSSKDPNLQNIPIKDEEGRRIRRAFVPQDGWSFVSADYSQIELVVLAHLSGDKNLCAAFREGRDIHRSTASLMFGVFEEMVNNDMRRAAKTINFGIMYGMSAFRLANELKISRKEADRFLEAYNREFAGVRTWFENVVHDAEKNGLVTTMLGHKRALPNILGRNRVEKQAAERIAMNTPIQGSAADIVKVAMLRVEKRLAAEHLQARLILQVHDELLVECPDSEVEAVKALLREEMEGAVKLEVPLRVGVESAKTWGSLH